MIKLVLKKLTATLLIGLTLVTIAPAAPAHAALFGEAAKEACKGTQLDGTAPAECDPNAATRVQTVLTVVLNVFSFIVGIIAVIMLIIGGLKYITSSGDSNSVNGAKNTILYAVIGLVIVLMAQFIVRFVIQKAGTPPL